MQTVPWQSLLQSAAIFNAAMLAGILCFDRRQRATRARFKLALFLAALAVALALFTAMDSGWIAAGVPAVSAEYFCGLIAGAALVDFTAGAVRYSGPVRGAYLVPAVVLPACLSLQPHVMGEIALMLAIGLQTLLTGAATLIYWRAFRRGLNGPRHLAWLIGGIWILHLVQFLRMSFPDSAWMYDAVPLVAASLFLGLTVLISADSRSLRAMVIEPVEPTAGPGLAQIYERLQTERGYLDPEFNLRRLAASMGVSARRLSSLLNEHGLSFYELLHEFRVRSAKALLLDPAEKRTSIEAIGLMVGYRSRSTFYEAFRKATDKTPAAYRQEGTL